MTEQVSAPVSASVAVWLPDDALVGTSVLAAIDARIAAWSERWFAQPVRRCENGVAPAAVELSPLPRDAWRRFAPGVWLDWGEQTPRVLALRALGRADLRPKLTADDGNLIQLLAERLGRDLAGSLAKLASQSPLEQDDGPGRAVCFRLCGASQTLNIAVAIDAAVLTSLRKQQCPPWRPREAQSQPLGTALGSVPVAFEAALGSVTIGLLELEALEPGDTIVLDQTLAAPIPLRDAASKANIRDTKLVREDGQFVLITS